MLLSWFSLGTDQGVTNERFDETRMGRRSYRRIGLHFRRRRSPGGRVLDWWFSNRDVVASGHSGDGFWVFLFARSSNTKTLTVS